jgi:hypothetical protein
MFYNRGRYLSRRAMLRGAGGVALGLPFLEAMTPATARAATIASPKRLGFVYFPLGYIKENWTPKTEGAGYELTPNLQPLAAFKDKFSVLSGLACDPAKTTAGFHDRAIASYMTGVEMIRGQPKSAISVDQIAAPILGKDVPFTSMETGVHELGLFGGPCYKSASNRLPFENNPRSLFERMFGDADRLDPQALAEMRRRQRSILDRVSSSASTLFASLGASDRERVKEYMESVRDIERRLAVMDNLAAKEIVLDRPAGPPDDYTEHVKLMMDLQLTALQTDMTRVWTFMMAMEASDQTFPEVNWKISHHQTSHHGNRPEYKEAISNITRYQAELFSYLLTKMEAVKEADGTLLDNSLLVYGSCLGDANRHLQVDLPVLMCGGAAMGLKGGRHLKFADNTPISNLYLTLLDKLGVPVDQMGDSTGQLRGLSDV